MGRKVGDMVVIKKDEKSDERSHGFKKGTKVQITQVSYTNEEDDLPYFAEGLDRLGYIGIYWIGEEDL